MNIILDWIKSMDANWVSAIAAVGAGIISIVAAIFAWWSARSAEKQNLLAIHQRQVDAYKAFHDSVGDYLQVGDEVSDALLGEIRSACTIIKFLFKPSVSNKVEGVHHSIAKIRGHLKIIRQLCADIKKDPAFYEINNTILQEKEKELWVLQSTLDTNYQHCLQLLEQEINLFQK